MISYVIPLLETMMPLVRRYIWHLFCLAFLATVPVIVRDFLRR